MIAFWAVAGVLSAVAAGLILHRAAAARATPLDPTLSVYRRQLAEIDDLAARGLLAEAEHQSTRAEAGRRLLSAAEHPGAAWTAEASMGRVAAMAALLTALLAGALYLAVGSPGTPDQPFARRLAAWRGADPTTLDAPQMAAVLQAVTAERPRDPLAWSYRGMAEAAAGDATEAVHSLRRAIELAPNRADLWERLGEMQMAGADGDVPPRAQAAFREALKRNPKSTIARFHLARAQILAGDREGGVAQWRALLADLPPAAPDRDALRAAIAEAERPAAAPAAGPQLPAIQGMVAGLAARLAAQPDDPEGWVRLVRSYAVLGDGVKRDAALKQARVRFASRADVLRDLDAAARTEPMR
jgi:cytochrome c-type biogenesis protein CcmH